MGRRSAITALCLLVTGPGWAEPGPIATDRPGNGNAATTVPAGTLQVEASVNYALSLTEIQTTHAVAFPTYIRIGATRMFELRFGHGLYSITSRPDSAGVDVGVPDLILGTKANLIEGNGGMLPTVGVSLDVSVPTGQTQTSAGAIVPDLRLLASAGLPFGFSVLSNLGLVSPEVNGEREFEALFVGNLGYALPFFQDRISVFAEIFSLVPLFVQRDALVQFDFGGAFLLTDTLQVDTFAQYALTTGDPVLQVAAGISKRF